MSLDGSLQVSAGFNVSGDSTISGDLTVGSGSVSAQGGLISAGDLEVDGDVKMGGQIEATNAIAINNATITLSASSSVYIPVNNGSVKVNTLYQYQHYGPTGTYTLVIPEVSGRVFTSSMANLGSATYSFAGKTATASPLTGVQQGGGSSFQASVKIPTKTITGITLTHGNKYSFKVTYTKSSSITSVETAG